VVIHAAEVEERARSAVAGASRCSSSGVTSTIRSVSFVCSRRGPIICHDVRLQRRQLTMLVPQIASNASDPSREGLRTTMHGVNVQRLARRSVAFRRILRRQAVVLTASMGRSSPRSSAPSLVTGWHAKLACRPVRRARPTQRDPNQKRIGRFLGRARR
jgi:hypothetical protein